VCGTFSIALLAPEEGKLRKFKEAVTGEKPS
jgi:hypothetical protein